MIKTIIFDIGNVLADFSWEPFFRSFGFSKEVFEKLTRATVKSPEWNELDRGEWSTEKIIASFIANDPSIKSEIELVFQDVSAMVTKRDYAIPWILHLKEAGYQVLYLSNLGEITHAHCQDALSFIPYTDGGILSYEVKMIKPKPAIYQALVDKYNLKPEECVFIDDTKVNVEAAAKLGFYVVHAVSHKAVLEGLSVLGVPPYEREENMSVLLERAKEIVEREFANRYEGGECYKLHAYRVMEAMDTEEEQIVALLHDIVEDTEVSLADLEGEGFSKVALGAIEDLTKGNLVRYFDYIEDLSLNPLAAKVKLAELKDNMDIVRVNRMSFRTYSLEDRCEKAVDLLTEALNERTS